MDGFQELPGLTWVDHAPGVDLLDPVRDRPLWELCVRVVPTRPQGGGRRGG
jgi:hypothetical protein